MKIKNHILELNNILKNTQPQFWKFIKKIIEKGPNTPKNCVLGTFFAEIAIAKNIFEAQITMVKNNILSRGLKIAIF